MLKTSQHIGFGSGGGSNKYYLFDVLTELGLTTDLKLCLDVADPNSYDGTSQTWVDRSGNANHFYRGATSGAEASDPTFNGAVGNSSESTYWGFDGGDYFKEAAAHTFGANIHKNNGLATLIAIFMPNTAKADRTAFFSTKETAVADAGINFNLRATYEPRITRSVTATTAQSTISTLFSTAAVFNFFAFGLDEAALAIRFRVNSATEDVGAITASTDTDPTSSPYTIGTEGATALDDLAQAGERLIALAFWDSFLSNVNTGLVYDKMKLRLVTLP
jgi:hypothetical protein